VYYVIAHRGVREPFALDGVRYGTAKEYGDLTTCTAARARGFGAEVKLRILVGTYVLSHGYTRLLPEAQKIAPDRARLRAASSAAT